MAEILNTRDRLLQAADPRVEPVTIPVENVEGLVDWMDGVGTQINSLLNNTKDLAIRATSTALTATTSTTLTLIRINSVEGEAEWSVFSGSGTLEALGDTCTIQGLTVLGNSITVEVKVGTLKAYATINKFGVLSAQDSVNLTTQTTGQLASGSVSGLGALALLNQVNLNTQTTGALNGLTQVNNLGNLAYANAVAANQIGAGTLAAGVIYAGTINASNITSGSMSADRISGGTLSGIAVNGTTVSALTVSTGGLTVNTGQAALNGGVYISTTGSLPPVRVNPSTNIYQTQPAGSLTLHPTYGICFVLNSTVYKVKAVGIAGTYTGVEI